MTQLYQYARILHNETGDESGLFSPGHAARVPSLGATPRFLTFLKHGLQPSYRKTHVVAEEMQTLTWDGLPVIPVGDILSHSCITDACKKFFKYVCIVIEDENNVAEEKGVDPAFMTVADE